MAKYHASGFSLVLDDPLGLLQEFVSTLNIKEWRGHPPKTLIVRTIKLMRHRDNVHDASVTIEDFTHKVIRDLGCYSKADFDNLIPDWVQLVEDGNDGLSSSL